MLNQGYFIISLDFELQWGSFDKISLDEKRKQELSNTISLIPKMLELFEKYNIAATWATVGMLFNKDKFEWEHNKPSVLPTYNNSKLNPYFYFNSLDKVDSNNQYFFANEMVSKIALTPLQEIATHTYSHYYCFENGQKQEQFTEDIFQVKRQFQKCKFELNSLVFPRNQFNSNYNKTLSWLGLQAIRTNPSVWYWNTKNKDTVYKKAFRLIDVFNVFNYSKLIAVQDLLKQKNKPYHLPASRFFKSFIKGNTLLNTLKINRIKLEMSYAAKYNKYYHLWWHPENFGSHPTENLQELEKILKHYTKLNSKFNFKSESMKSFSKLLQFNS